MMEKESQRYTQGRASYKGDVCIGDIFATYTVKQLLSKPWRGSAFQTINTSVSYGKQLRYEVLKNVRYCTFVVIYLYT